VNIGWPALPCKLSPAACTALTPSAKSCAIWPISSRAAPMRAPLSAMPASAPPFGDIAWTAPVGCLAEKEKAPSSLLVTETIAACAPSTSVGPVALPAWTVARP
jgi:hypothetical protein